MGPSFTDISMKKFVGFHIGFLIIAFVSLFLPLTLSTGYRFLILVFLYNVITFIYVIINREMLLKIWLFSFTLSILMVFPDRILSEVLGILVFPELQGLMIGSVPLYMALLWTIPVNVIIFITFKLSNKVPFSPVVLNMVATVLMLVSSEFYSHLIGTWRAENVTLVLGAAIYIIPAEIFFGLAIYYAVRDINSQSYGKILLRAFAVVIFYIGSAVFFYHSVEFVLLNP